MTIYLLVIRVIHQYRDHVFDVVRALVPGETGFVHEVAQRHFDGRFAGNSAYLCGPPPMIDACITGLMRGRLFERDIFMEKFISAADAAQNSQRSPLFKSL